MYVSGLKIYLYFFNRSINFTFMCYKRIYLIIKTDMRITYELYAIRL